MADGACPDRFLAFARTLPEISRPIVMRYFRAGLAVEQKADDSPVTVADRDAEAALRAAIEDAFPDHGILGEEHGSVRLDADYVWVLQFRHNTGFVEKPFAKIIISTKVAW